MQQKKNIQAYSVAIFDLVQEENKFQQLHPQFEAVKELFTHNAEFTNYFYDDFISLNERLKTIDLAFKGFDWIIINALKVIVARGVAKHIRKIMIEYLKLSNRVLKIRFIDVISAFPLTNEQLEQIKNKIQISTRRSIEITNHVDPSLIAGIKIVSRTETMELNIKHQLEKMKYEILKYEKEV
ncbi:F-type H+-transporting ATPase subunit delta [Mycoplasmopsis mustelae]|uniref:ATP synthase subunit delta n=1 Tax=Mycoplasmopsis mustelae TaxID=171289 RepID=A0A4R7UCE7_9BACT|nr:ATP synthase F1 subunit delta [Mycoplasmopsis mustelae]TDV24102.1 F-type H+-transporting ATPase subunit delta [Mycoplasmopsis mustelae]